MKGASEKFAKSQSFEQGVTGNHFEKHKQKIAVLRGEHLLIRPQANLDNLILKREDKTRRRLSRFGVQEIGILMRGKNFLEIPC